MPVHQARQRQSAGAWPPFFMVAAFIFMVVIFIVAVRRRARVPVAANTGKAWS